MAQRVAAIIGGSIAGLLSAQVLSESYDQVVIFERDDLSVPGHRKGTPQSQHVHVLLAAGSAALERLVPGLFEDIAAAGGRYIDMSQHNNWFHFGVWKRRFVCGVKAHAQSRILLEAMLRRRVLSQPNVSLRRAGVSGVTWPRGRPRLLLADESVDVDFLVDASGRGSRLAQWLQMAGHARPRQEDVRVDVTYTSARYRFTGKRDWMGLLLYPNPPAERRAAAVLPTETGEIIVSQFGWCGDGPGSSDRGFADFARGLPQPEVADFLAQSERVSDFQRYRFREARLLHYAELPRHAPHTIAIGDALCSVDPVFGQGMTVAALSADLLARHLRDEDPARGYFRDVPTAYRAAWQLSTAEDFRYDEVQGRRPLGTAFSHWYTAHVHRLSAVDDDVYRRFARVMHLLEPPSHLFHPSVLAKVLSSALGGQGAASPRPREPHP